LIALDAGRQTREWALHHGLHWPMIASLGPPLREWRLEIKAGIFFASIKA
jgi:hypothetical protein